VWTGVADRRVLATDGTLGGHGRLTVRSLKTAVSNYSVNSAFGI
jgi:hypothetical protein